MEKEGRADLKKVIRGRIYINIPSLGVTVIGTIDEVAIGHHRCITRLVDVPFVKLISWYVL